MSVSMPVITYWACQSYRLFQRRSLTTLTMLSLAGASYSIWVALGWSDELTRGGGGSSMVE